MAAADVAADATLSCFWLSVCVAATLQELEKLEVERIEWIQQHLRQYTTLRHETDMFNQSVSPRGRSPAVSPAPPPPQLPLLSFVRWWNLWTSCCRRWIQGRTGSCG